METINFAEKLWDLANIITGFAIAQVLATTFALVKGELPPLTGTSAHGAAFILTTGFTVAYIWAIRWCEREWRQLEAAKLATGQEAIWHSATQGRIFAVVLFTLVLLLALLGHWHGERTKPNLPAVPTATGR
jgi:uncharacterized membrane protein YidH (DUF202 family)